MINQYSEVKLTSSQYAEKGVKKGSVGYVIDVYSDEHFDVEFSAQDGSTIAILVLAKSEFELCE